MFVAKLKLVMTDNHDQIRGYGLILIIFIPFDFFLFHKTFGAVVPDALA